MKMLEDYCELPRKSTCWTSLEMCVCSVERYLPDRVACDVLWVAIIIIITAAAAADASSCLAWPSLFQHFYTVARSSTAILRTQEKGALRHCSGPPCVVEETEYERLTGS